MLITKIPSWDEYFMSLAFLASTRSKDPQTKVGCVAVFGDKSFHTGYNGCPANFNDNLLNTDLKQKVVLHAESSCLDIAGLDKCRSEKNLVLYLTIKCCPHCALKLVHFNVKRVVYASEYKSTVNDDELLELIRHRGGLSGEPAFTLEKFKGDLLFSHTHMGIKCGG